MFEIESSPLIKPHFRFDYGEENEERDYQSQHIFIQNHSEKPAKSFYVSLDLNNTLVLLSEIPKGKQFKEILVDGKRYYLSLRPYLEKFLIQLSAFAHIYLFTSQSKCFVDQVLKIIDPSAKFFDRVFYGDSCLTTPSGRIIKDISILQTPLGKTVHLDDNGETISQQSNTVRIRPFFGSSSDKELLSAIEFLRILQFQEDVRKLICNN